MSQASSSQLVQTAKDPESATVLDVHSLICVGALVHPGLAFLQPALGNAPVLGCLHARFDLESYDRISWTTVLSVTVASVGMRVGNDSQPEPIF